MLIDASTSEPASSGNVKSKELKVGVDGCMLFLSLYVHLYVI